MKQLTEKKLDVFFGALAIEAARREIMTTIEKKAPEVAAVVRREIKNSTLRDYYTPARLEQDTLFSLAQTSARWKPLDEFPEDPHETVNQITEAIILTGRARLLMARRTRENGAVAVLEAAGV